MPSFVQRPASALMATAVYIAKEDSYMQARDIMKYHHVCSFPMIIMIMTSICRYNVQCAHIIRAISLQSTSSTARWWVSCTLRAKKRGECIQNVHRLAITMTTTVYGGFAVAINFKNIATRRFVVVIFAPILLSSSLYGKSHWSMRKKRLHNKFIWHDDAIMRRVQHYCTYDRAVRSRITMNRRVRWVGRAAWEHAPL